MAAGSAIDMLFNQWDDSTTHAQLEKYTFGKELASAANQTGRQKRKLMNLWRIRLGAHVYRYET